MGLKVTPRRAGQASSPWSGWGALFIALVGAILPWHVGEGGAQPDFWQLPPCGPREPEHPTLHKPGMSEGRGCLLLSMDRVQRNSQARWP